MGRQASSICLRVLVGMMSSSQCLFFMAIITVHTPTSVSGWKDANLGVPCYVALYAGLLMNVSLMFSILDRKNLVKSSASSSSVLFSGKGFCVVLPLSLLTRQKSSLVSFLQSKLSYLPIVF